MLKLFFSGNKPQNQGAHYALIDMVFQQKKTALNNNFQSYIIMYLKCVTVSKYIVAMPLRSTL